MPYPRHLLWYILPQNTPNSQNLLPRCPPTDSSLGGYGILPYPRHLLWDILPRNTPNSQNLLLRCPPTDFSLGGYGILPYPRHLLWDILPQNTPNSQNLLLRCPPTDFTDLHRYLGCAVLPQNSQNLVAWVWQGCHTLLICEHPCHLWEALLCQKFLCVPCVLWECLFFHGFHRSAQILRVRCSPTEFTEFTEFGSVGMAGMPYPPTSVRICAICGRLFSARSFCAFRAFCGNIFSPTDFTD